MTDADHTDAVDPVDPAADDWAPLPEEMRLLHPGELVDPAAQPAPSIPGVHAPQAAVADPDSAEQALNELKARIATSAPPTSLVAEVVHREERKERQQRAANVVRAADAAIMQGGRQPRDPLPIEYDAGVHGRDPREEEAWYKALPDEEQRRLQAAWAEKRQHAVSSKAIQRRNGNRRLVAALIVFATVIITGTGIQWAATAGAGICCGIWWRHARPDRFLDPLRAVGSFFGLHMIAWAAHGTISPLMFMDTVLLIGFATIVGFDGEIKRTGGFDSK
jgi:hypothetical protein